MDRDPREHFEEVIALAHVQVVQNDVTASRAILQIRGRFRGLDATIKEIRAASGVLYSYYLLKSGTVIVGFDNYPDMRCIKAKFGRQYKRHLGVLIPHRHGRGKKSVDLTAEYSAEEFLEGLEQFAATQ